VLEAERPRYVLRSPVVLPGRTTVRPAGVDDPGLLPAVALAPLAPAPQPATVERQPVAVEPVASAPPEPAVPSAAETVVPPRRAARRRALVAAVPALAGMLVAYTVASGLGADPLPWTAAGGVGGWAAGWLLLSWIPRED